MQCVRYARDTRAYSADIITMRIYVAFMQRARVNFQNVEFYAIFCLSP